MKKTSIGTKPDQASGAAYNAGVKEEDLLNQIIDLAHIFGWRIAHFRPARTKSGWRTAVAGDGAGFPDCVFVKEGRLIFAELKREKGQVSPKQQEWLDALVKVPGIEVYLWRPSDTEEIVEILSKKRLRAIELLKK